jgi:ribonuclease HI
MKALKFNHIAAQAVASGASRTTWRINDDKDLAVNDQFEVIDKVVTTEPNTWQVIGTASIDSVAQKRLADLSEEEMASITAESSSALLAISREYYGEQVSPETPVKLVTFRFVPYDQPKSRGVVANGQHYKQLRLYADGGSRGNPGPSASGYVLLGPDDTVIKKSGVYLGITTNNQAEYQALKLGLEEALKLGAREVGVYMDSMLVVNQMKGIFKVKNRDLWPIHQAIKDIVAQFKQVDFSHVPRELNKLADAEVNDTLDAELH